MATEGLFSRSSISDTVFESSTFKIIIGAFSDRKFESTQNHSMQQLLLDKWKVIAEGYCLITILILSLPKLFIASRYNCKLPFPTIPLSIDAPLHINLREYRINFTFLETRVPWLYTCDVIADGFHSDLCGLRKSQHT